MATRTKTPSKLEREYPQGVQWISRDRAERVIEVLRRVAADPRTSQSTRDFVRGTLRAAGWYDVDGKPIEPLEACNGEAHSNAYIDHCGRCAPWGFVGKHVKVR